jgi:hypothetical protein
LKPAENRKAEEKKLEMKTLRIKIAFEEISTYRQWRRRQCDSNRRKTLIIWKRAAINLKSWRRNSKRIKTGKYSENRRRRRKAWLSKKSENKKKEKPAKKYQKACGANACAGATAAK